jgi:hypothetical protein
VDTRDFLFPTVNLQAFVHEFEEAAGDDDVVLDHDDSAVLLDHRGNSLSDRIRQPKVDR